MTRPNEGEPQPTRRGGQNREPIRYADFSEMSEDQDYLREIKLLEKEFQAADFEVELFRRREEGFR